MSRAVALIAVLTLALLACAGTASAQTATPTATPSPTPTATLSPTPSPTASAGPQIACGAGPAAGGATAAGVCGGVCAPNFVCRWNTSAADGGCQCLAAALDCDPTNSALAGGGMCQQGVCDRSPDQPGGNCTTRGKRCRCE